LPVDVYEATIASIITAGLRWLDVGGGRMLFEQNDTLAAKLAARCYLVAVDPSCNVLENPHANERVQAAIEDYDGAQFDLATLSMVAEHLQRPESTCAALARLLRPGGTCVIFTVSRWSPASVVARFTPLIVHHALKAFVWQTEERDTFPAYYRLNTRRSLSRHMTAAGFKEVAFTRLDDLSISAQSRYWHWLELALWRALRACGLYYPECCLLGIYQRAPS
jgi:SAM-dependent methyltransferase